MTKSKSIDLIQVAFNTLEKIEENLIKQDIKCKLDISFEGTDILQIDSELGTYVINISSANNQIWLSSPISGPSHFTYINKCWANNKNNKKLYDLLEEELAKLIPNICLKNELLM